MSFPSSETRECLPPGFTLELDLDVDDHNVVIISHKCDDGVRGEAELVLVDERKSLSCQHCHHGAFVARLRL